MTKLGEIYTSLPEEYLKQVLNYEGGYLSAEKAKQIGDKGGETCRGITAFTLANAIRQKLVSPTITCKDLLTNLEAVRIIYDINYYKKGYACVLPHPLSFVHFDSGVNHGIGNAAKFLQSTINKFKFCNISVDGGIGQKTLSAFDITLNKVGIVEMTKEYINIRKQFYDKIVLKNPNQSKFYKGWINRLNNVKKFSGV